MMNFEKFNLHSKITAGVQAIGYTVPTPIQLQSIPPILEGKDVLGLAQTGTGKTAAFVLPILQRLVHGSRGIVRALIIAPTRELTEQTHQSIGLLGRKTRLRSTSIYGGVNIQPQISKLSRGVDIISACPGRLLDHINRRTIDLSHIEVLVLDEADLMFDMGFLPDIRKILKHLPAGRQTLLFSATMPDDVKSLANEVLEDPVRVKIGRTAPADTVSHTFYPVETHLKTALLKNILNTTETGPVLVFTRTKMRAKSVGYKLEKSGYDATALHGNLSQNKRQEALDGFRSGRYKILVATDVAARGIDVRGVSHVINYDIPESANSYTHRIGRTGRACETGDAFTFVTSRDKGPAFSITRVLGNKLKHCVMEDFDSTPPVRERKSVHKRTRAQYENKNRLAKSKPRKRPKSKYPPETVSRRNTFVN
jgi:ATP-dependent RNA helicase RhlE